MGTGPFPRVKRPGRGVDHPPLSSAEVKGTVELYLYCHWAFVACKKGEQNDIIQSVVFLFSPSLVVILPRKTAFAGAFRDRFRSQGYNTMTTV
jgi:hypothetical protein